MAQITREQTIDLARTGIGGGADRIERVYQWKFERALTAMRAALVLAGSILGALLAALLGGSARLQAWQYLIAAGALAGSFGAAAYQYPHLGRLHGEYLESLRSFGVVERALDPWIRSRSS